jgi:glycosyltransferase involved in cell wall biosynthesis
MRIAILNHGFPPDVGGGETQAYITAATLQSHGHDVHVFTGKGDRQLEFPFAVSYLTHYKTFEKGEQGPKYFVKELKDALIAAGEFDVLYCSNFSALLAVSYMRDIVKTKTVFTFHCVPAEEQRKVIGYFDDWDLEKSYARHILAAAKPSLTICPSGFFYNWAKEFGLPESNLKVIYNSVILSDFAVRVSPKDCRDFRKENGLPPDAFIFLTPARMLPKKGIYELVQAARMAPPNAYFYIVSSKRNANQEFLETITSLISEHGLGDRVKLRYDMYSIAEMPKLYQLCDAMLLPSHHEGLPVTMLEAMASKRLVACTDIPALRELIQDGKNGLACKAKDIKSLHEMITKVVAMTPHERQKLATKGFRTVLEKGDADKNMRLLETAFTQA